MEPKGMTVLSARYADGRPVEPFQYKKDLKTLLKEHEKAKRHDLTWAAFGGIIKIGDRKYQVA